MPETPAATPSPIALTHWDLIVVGFFFLFMMAIGWMCRKLAGNQSEYFRGGGKMLWWLVGATAFMTQFSAWTFTGAAGEAYKFGVFASMVFWGNAIGYLLNAAVMAVRFRRMRVITSYEAVRERFGHENEQVFTWLQIPVSIIYGGMWLNGLAIVASSYFGFDMTWTTIIAGAVVVFISVSGGAWAVVASDFIQMLLLMAVSLVTAYLTLGHADIGGVSGFVEKSPAGQFNMLGAPDARFVVAWAFTAFVVQSFKMNSINESYRYLCVKDDSNARKSGLLAAFLMILGPAVWFIPPMAARIVEPNIGAALPSLKNPEEGAYILMAAKTLPVGMLGLLVCGIFAATMSSMDAALNRNAGIFLRSFYHPILRKDASEKELFFVGQVASLVAGALTIGVALYVNAASKVSLFDAMTLFGTLVAIPVSMPLVWGVFVKKAPRWSAWSTVLVGFGFSLLAKYVLTTENLGMGDLPKREQTQFLYTLSGLGNVVVCSLWFFATTLFSPKLAEDQAISSQFGSPGGDAKSSGEPKVEEFFRKLRTPITHDEEKSAVSDFTQARLLGILSSIYAAFILLLAVIIPNSMDGRIAFLTVAAIVGGVGGALIYAAKKGTAKQ